MSDEPPRSGAVPTTSHGPGQADGRAAPAAEAGPAWMHVCVIVALGLLVFFFRVGAADWRDEADTHQGLMISRIMAGDGWIVPLRNGRHLPDKPPLFSWLGVLSATLRATDGDLLDARLPSAMGALATTLIVYGWARRLAGGRVALWSALVLMTTPQFVLEGRDSRVDMVFCTFLTAALVLVWRVWEGAGGRRAAALAGLCFGLAVLAKGPLALVLGVAVFGVTAVVAPPAPGWRVLLRPAPLLLSLAVPAAWYGTATAQQGTAFLYLHLFKENVGRMIGAQDHSPVWYYLEPLITMGLPWTIALPFVAFGASALPARARRFLWAWVGAMFIFFTLSLGKRRAYLLPLRPALAIVVAAWLVPQLQRWRGHERAGAPPRTLRIASVTVPVALGIFVLALGLGVGGLAAAPTQWSYWWCQHIREFPGTAVVFVVAIGIGADQVLRGLWQRRVEWAAYAFAATLAVGVAFVIASDAIVRGEAMSFRLLAHQVRAAVAADAPVMFLDTDDEDAISLQFKLRRRITVVHTIQGSCSCTPPQPGVYLMQEAQWDARGCASDPAWRMIARGGPEIGRHRKRRLVCARYAPAARAGPDGR